MCPIQPAQCDWRSDSAVCPWRRRPFCCKVSSATFASCLHSARFVYRPLLFGRRRVISSCTPRNEPISIKGEKQRYFTGENWETPKGIGRAFVQVITAAPPLPGRETDFHYITKNEKLCFSKGFHEHANKNEDCIYYQLLWPNYW